MSNTIYQTHHYYKNSPCLNFELNRNKINVNVFLTDGTQVSASFETEFLLDLDVPNQIWETCLEEGAHPIMPHDLFTNYFREFKDKTWLRIPR